MPDPVIHRTPIFQSALTEEGGFVMVINSAEHHLEIEVSPTLEFEWFYSNRETDEFRGEDGPVPQEILDLLRQFNA